MNIAVDIDGTLTRDKEQLTKLMQSITSLKGKVILLTGSINMSPHPDSRPDQLKALGVPRDSYGEIVVCDGQNYGEVAKKKGIYCRDNKIDMMFEDSDFYIEEINRISPDTSTWLIRRF